MLLKLSLNLPRGSLLVGTGGADGTRLGGTGGAGGIGGFGFGTDCGALGLLTVGVDDEPSISLNNDLHVRKSFFVSRT